MNAVEAANKSLVLLMFLEFSCTIKIVPKLATDRPREDTILAKRTQGAEKFSAAKRASERASDEIEQDERLFESPDLKFTMLVLHEMMKSITCKNYQHLEVNKFYIEQEIIKVSLV